VHNIITRNSKNLNSFSISQELLLLWSDVVVYLFCWLVVDFCNGDFVFYLFLTFHPASLLASIFVLVNYLMHEM